MRLIAIFPVICTAGALILSFLCLFAGSKTGQLEYYDLMTVNTSRIGLNFFTSDDNVPTAPSNSGDNSGIEGWFQNITNILQNATAALENDIENAIESALNNTLESFARDLGLHDFYSFHIQDYCEGYYSPNGTSNRNVSYCSPNDGLHPFNITARLESELKNATGFNITLQQIDWPESITNTYKDLRTAFRAVYVIYCLTIALAGIAFITSLVGIFLQGRITAIVNNSTVWFAACFSIIVSSVVTWAITYATDKVNEEGDVINVSAHRGNKFLGLTWAATVLLWLAGFVWIWECLKGRKKEKKIPKQYQ